MLKLVANSERVDMDDSRGGVETLYKYLIRQSSQPASAVQTHSTKYLVSLMWLACGDLEKNCEITNMLDSS